MQNDEKTGDRQPVRAGRFFTQDEIGIYCTNFEGNEPKNGELRKAEFFSRDILEQLLSIKECDGLRVYYGLAPENKDGKIDTYKGDKDNLKPRLFLVPVTVERDAAGNPTEKNHDQTFHLRIDAGKGDGDEYGGAGGGNPCPTFCNS